MASAVDVPETGPHGHGGLGRALRAAVHELIPQRDETDLVANSANEELLEESGRVPADLHNREAALLGYIKSRES